MDGAVFGSYSTTEFIDLYYLNVRDNHHYSFFFEVSPNGIEGIEQGKCDLIKKRDSRNYLIGILTDDIDTVRIEKSTLEFFESKYDKPIEYLIDTKKEFFYFAYEDSRIAFTSFKVVTFHVGQHRSFSTVSPPSGFVEVSRNLGYSMPIFRDGCFDYNVNEL